MFGIRRRQIHLKRFKAKLIFFKIKFMILKAVRIDFIVRVLLLKRLVYIYPATHN